VKEPPASGEESWEWTLRPPADSPKIVTLSGSPPNARMLRCTHPTQTLSAQEQIPQAPSRVEAKKRSLIPPTRWSPK